MLKIMGGQARGRVLKIPRKTPGLRPILARVKKSLFDIIRPRLPNARFLDLYAGSGAVGMEALSRGASHATFVETDGAALRLLKENLEALGFLERATTVRGDVTGELGHLPGPFDIIFVGPPYVDADKRPLALVEPSLTNVVRFGLLAPAGVVVAQHHKKEPVPERCETLVRKRQERYGDTVLSFFETAV